MLISDGLKIVEEWLCANRLDYAFAFVVTAISAAVVYLAAVGLRTKLRAY